MTNTTENKVKPEDLATDTVADNTVTAEAPELSQQQLDNAAGGTILEEARHFLGLDKYDQF